MLSICRAVLIPQEYAELTFSPDLPAPPASLPEFTNTNQIRQAIKQVTDLVLCGRITNKQASLLLYALQTALSALRTAARVEPAPPIATNAIGFNADTYAEVSRAERARMTTRTRTNGNGARPTRGKGSNLTRDPAADRRPIRSMEPGAVPE